MQDLSQGSRYAIGAGRADSERTPVEVSSHGWSHVRNEPRSRFQCVIASGDQLYLSKRVVQEESGSCGHHAGSVAR